MPSESRPSRQFTLQLRDLAIFRALFESRVMTSAHVSALFFSNRPEAAKKRILALKGAGLIATRPRRSNEPALLFLARSGLLVLQAEGILSEYPALDLPALERRSQVGNLTVRHELDVVDVKVAFHCALNSSSKFSLAEFSTWPLLHQFDAASPEQGSRKVLVKPDGYMQIVVAEGCGGRDENRVKMAV